MRYIKTKDTIFEVVEETDLVYRVKAKRNPNNIYSKSKCATYVIKQANTIEELCDEFIGIDNSDYHFHFTELEKINGNYSYLNEEYKAFYGAIWTDKGLIYVAKMNEKGELELL